MIRLIRNTLIAVATIFFPCIVFAVDYHIGPGQPNETIGGFAWGGVVAGDSIYIHAKPNQEPYRERICITAILKGTQANPIKIVGVSDEFGNKPYISGENSTTGLNFQLYGSPQYHSRLGLLFIGPGPDYGSYPDWVEITNLKFSDYTNVTTTTEDGVTVNNFSGETVYIQGGNNLTLDNCDISGGRDGVFAKTGSSPVENLTIKKSNIHDNGVVGDYLYHNIYTEVNGLTIDRNTFGKLIAGSPGNNLKDRSAGLVVRYNTIHNGGHLIDIVECQDGCAERTVRDDWNDVFVYGNVMHADNDGPGYLIHLGAGDLGSNQAYWRKNLYFYNNTVIVDRDITKSYYVTLFQLSGSSQNVYADNNIFHFLPYSSTLSQIVLQYDGSGAAYAAGNIYFGVNYLTPGWYSTRPGYTLTGSITGTGNLVSPVGNDPVFTSRQSGNYRLAQSSPCLGVGNVLPSAATSKSLIPIYNVDGVGRTGYFDLGAYGDTDGAPAPIRVRGYRVSGEMVH